MSIAIITLLSTALGVAYKMYHDHHDYKALEAKLAVTERALVRMKTAGEEGVARAKSMEDAFRAHLKTCSVPLAGWANELLGGSGSKDPGK